MHANDLLNSPDLPKRAVALILAGGRGRRLHHLTERRAKPAVYFGGKFRIIDFALSNCLNSGIRRIGVITQYKSHSLLRHLQRGWAFLKTEMNEFVDLLPAQQRMDEETWYRGTADAVSQNRDILDSYDAEYVVVLGGDHIYKMNYAVMLADHVAKGRECTVACIEVSRQEAMAFGVMAVDAQWNITDFVEKPAEPPCVPGSPERSLASMGIYIFNAPFLYDELERDMADSSSTHDFGKDIIPRAVRLGQAAAHPFAMSCVTSSPAEAPYWRDVGTIDSYWDANIDLIATEPLLNLYDTRWPVWTHQPQLAPAKFVHNHPDRRGMAVESLGLWWQHHLWRRVSLGVVLAGAGAFVFEGRVVGAVARGRSRPPRAPVTRSDRSWLSGTRWHGDRRGRGARRSALLPHRKWHHTGDQVHAECIAFVTVGGALLWPL